MVENQFDIPTASGGYSYTRTRFTAGAGGQINPSIVHSFNLYNEINNPNGCCGIGSTSWGDVWFRFDIPGAPGPIQDNTGALINSPFPIYFVYEWTAVGIRTDGSKMVYNASGQMPDTGGDFSWTQPQLPHGGQSDSWVPNGTFTGSRAGVFYSWTGGDYRFLFANDVAQWGEASMEFNIRLAFSDQPFTSIPGPVGSAPPTANAGGDQTVDEGALVTLDGSGSNDLNGDTLTYTWSQLSGPQVSLNLTDPVHPTFTAPLAAVGGDTLTFQLIVNDGQSDSDPDTVDIIVKNVNQKPVAEAGAEQIVNEGTVVTLNGSSSYDPDGEAITYSWVRTAGPTVSLSDPQSPTPTFTAPTVGMGGATLAFELTVSDGVNSATDTVDVFVENVNHQPTANAGTDQTKNEGTLVTLDGTGSNDSDGDGLTYAWTQVAGPSVALSDSSSSTPSFTAPLVGPGGATLVFQVVVNDGLADSLPDEVAITVQNVNDPPDCRLAQPTLTTLWPPNHKLISVGITGVTDPDKDGVVISITGVTQDELVNGLGDGDTSPDAVIQRSNVLLRAERSGKGNGRVYRVNFTADDGQGGVCAGSVNVGVPHSMKPGMSAVDDGQLYDSTQP